MYEDLDNLVNHWNEEYITEELKVNKALFNKIAGKSLDSQQRKAIVVDETNNLVIASAGSGKTLTISGKVKYLVERKNIAPEEILLISFTRKASEEMDERISKKLGINVDVMTFHKLGLNIISSHNQEKPSIYDDIRKVINEYFNTKIFGNNKRLTELIEFFGVYLNIPKNIEEFDTLGDYYNQSKNSDLETIKSKIERYSKDNKKDKKTYAGESVKSLEEVMIANFLYLHGINYIYEAPFKFKTATQYYRQYSPDFYLPDYDIYIEHFGISQDMSTPWLTKIEEEKYLEGMRWKRSIHRKYKTTLIETYSYYNQSGELLDKLKEKLEKKSVEFKTINYKEVYEKIIINQPSKSFEEFKKLVATFIKLFKSNGFDKSQFKQIKLKNIKESNYFLKRRTQLFLDIVEPIFITYEEYLNSNGFIDFDDMINMSTEIIKNHGIEKQYKYIIIDEYQDISVSRYKLIKAIKDKTKAKLLCVGDDWQSIYRFAGSDINLFNNFEKFFGYYKLLKIEKTYRNSQQLIDTAAKFIMKNPMQFKKKPVSKKLQSSPIVFNGCANRSELADALIYTIDEIAKEFGEKSEIMLLGRNNFDINIIENHPEFNQSYDQKNNYLKVIYNKYPKLKMYFLTVHRSKGLEANNVIIINAINSLVGFPNQISDDPILSYVLTDSENYSFAEERRLFYVALTRTKNKTYIIAPESQESIFAKELKDGIYLREGYNYNYISDHESIQNNPICPKCQKGYLVRREKNGRFFIGCTNYPLCDFTNKNVDILEDKIECDECGAYLVKRKGKNGEFYGCINFPHCYNTQEIEYDPYDIKMNDLLEEDLFFTEKEKNKDEIELNDTVAEKMTRGNNPTTYIIDIDNEVEWACTGYPDIELDSIQTDGKDRRMIEEFDAEEDLNIDIEDDIEVDIEDEIEDLIAKKTFSFDVGGEIIHEKFGKGTVVGKSNDLLKVEFENGIKKNLSYSMCIEKEFVKPFVNKDIEDVITHSASYFDVGKQIIHKLFGKGQIVESNKKFIKVSFENGELISFSYEACNKEEVITPIKDMGSTTLALEQLIKLSDKMAEKEKWDRKALEVNKKIINNGKDNLIYYIRIARCYKKLDGIEEAVDLYRTILNRDVKNKEANDYLEIYGKGIYKKSYDMGESPYHHSDIHPNRCI